MLRQQLNKTYLERTLKALGRTLSAVIQENRAWIKCPFHDDHSPSCSVNLNPSAKVPVGTFYCFSCGEGGRWEKLAEKLGVQTETGAFDVTTYSKPDSLKTVKAKLDEEDENTDLQELTKATWSNVFNFKPVSNHWRGMHKEFLSELGCLQAVMYNNPVLIMPVMVYGDLVGVINARWKKHKKYPSYMLSKGNWSRSNGLYPFDYVRGMLQTTVKKHVVLVEGQRDAMRLITENIPALCIFGVNSWSDEKRELVLSLNASVTVCGDSDKAGQKMNETLYASLKGYCPVRVFNLKDYAKKNESIDPYSMDDSIVNRIRKWRRS